MTYEVVIKGFQTKEQAKEFVSWYSGQGEQDIQIWLGCQKTAGVCSMDTIPPYNNWRDEITLEMYIDPK
jgi:hypothetical protein